MTEPSSAAADVVAAIRAGDALALDAVLTREPAAAAARGDGGISAVLLALYHRRPDLADLLLAHDPPLGAPEWTALGMVDELAAALGGGRARAGERSPDGFPLLGLAAFFGQDAVVELLLRSGAAVDDPARNAMAVTPLHAAAAAGRVDIARRLLAAGAHPSATQTGGWTPLHQAASAGNVPLARALLEAGADRAARSDEGRTPADLARDAGHTDLAAEIAGEGTSRDR